MIFSIPNPKKDLTIPFSISQTQKALSNMSEFCQETGKGSYLKEKFDPILNPLILTKTEFLSLGVRIVIDASYISEGQTRVSVEIQRIIGSFDEQHEVSKANRHMNVLTSALSELLQNPNFEPKIIDPIDPIEKGENEKSAELRGLVLGGFVLLILGLIIM